MFIEIVFHSHSVTIFQAEKCSWYGAPRHPRIQKRQRVSQHSEKNLEGGAWERGRGRQVVLAANCLSLLLSPILELPYYRWGLVLSS